jgi:hypothetical protein
MQGSLGRAPVLAAVPESPPGPVWEVLAEVAGLFRDNPDGQPPLGDQFIQFKAQGATHDEKMQCLWAFARFLGVGAEFRNQVHFAQRRFGTAGNSITLDMHYTPDFDKAFAEQVGGAA